MPVKPILAALMLFVVAPAFAHDDTSPRHGGDVMVAGETVFEQVRAPAGIAWYVRDDGAPPAAAGASTTMAVTTGDTSRTVALVAGPGNRFDTPERAPTGPATPARLAIIFTVD